MQFRFILPLIAFLFIQTVGLLHAVEHPFHEHHEECDIYIDADRLSKTSFTAVVFLWTVEYSTESYEFTFKPQQALTQAFNHYQSRAPPKPPISA